MTDGLGLGFGDGFDCSKEVKGIGRFEWSLVQAWYLAIGFSDGFGGLGKLGFKD